METTQNQGFEVECCIPADNPKAMIEVPVGTQLFINGKLVRCVRTKRFFCKDCIFFENKATCTHIKCISGTRQDRLEVHFEHALKD